MCRACTSTYYGPHGMEFLHITYGDMDLPLANLLPHGKCFAGAEGATLSACPCTLWFLRLPSVLIHIHDVMRWL